MKAHQCAATHSLRSTEIRIRVVNGLILKPKLGPSPTFILKPDLGPKAKFTEWVKVCATAGYQKT